MDGTIRVRDMLGNMLSLFLFFKQFFFTLLEFVELCWMVASIIIAQY